VWNIKYGYNKNRKFLSYYFPKNIKQKNGERKSMQEMSDDL
jgi:hypothetical protein